MLFLLKSRLGAPLFLVVVAFFETTPRRDENTRTPGVIFTENRPQRREFK